MPPLWNEVGPFRYLTDRSNPPHAVEFGREMKSSSGWEIPVGRATTDRLGDKELGDRPPEMSGERTLYSVEASLDLVLLRQ